MNIAESNIKFLAYSKIIKSIITAVLFAAGVFIAEFLAAIASLLVSQMIIYYLYDKKFTFINHQESQHFAESI